jgi:hypothetical protein
MATNSILRASEKARRVHAIGIPLFLIVAALLGTASNLYAATVTASWNANPEPDIAGYAILIRATTAPLWEREIYVGNVTEYSMPDMSIDDVVIGVRAIDKEGNPSLVSAYTMAPTRTIEATPPPQQRPPGTGGQ